jgi:hypothetical protein
VATLRQREAAVDVKQMIILPIFWGNWWLPDQGAYNWAEVGGLMGRVVTMNAIFRSDAKF